MKNITLAIILLSTFSVAESQFNKEHKVNKSYTKTMAKDKSKRGNSGSKYIKIRNKKELKKLLKKGRFKSKQKGRGDRYVVIDINRRIHLNKRDLKDLKEINIGSDIQGNGKVQQVINIKGLTVDTYKNINIGTNITEDRRGSVTAITNIAHSRLGR